MGNGSHDSGAPPTPRTTTHLCKGVVVTRNGGLPSAAHGLLHPGGGHGGGWAGHGDASERVDDGNGIATTGGSGLVELETGMVVHVRGDEGGSGRVEREARGDRLRLLRRGGFRRVAGKRRAFRGRRDGNQLWIATVSKRRRRGA